MTRAEKLDILVQMELDVNFSDRSFVREMILAGFTGLEDMDDATLDENLIAHGICPECGDDLGDYFGDERLDQRVCSNGHQYEEETP